MNKSQGERKRKYLRKNKNNRKKDGFSPQKNPCSAHKSLRAYVKSYMKQTNYDGKSYPNFFILKNLLKPIHGGMLDLDNLNFLKPIINKIKITSFF